MEILIMIIIGIIIGILLLLGIIGCFIPVIPGPPISYCGLLVFHFFSPHFIEENTLWFMAFVVIAVTVFDLWVQIYGVKKFGGTKKAVNGSIIGLIIGIFIFGPLGLGLLGMIFGPFIGAFIGAKMDDPDVNKALRIALGALAGFVVGTLVKLSVSLYIFYIIYASIPSLW